MILLNKGRSRNNINPDYSVKNSRGVFMFSSIQPFSDQCKVQTNTLVRTDHQYECNNPFLHSSKRHLLRYMVRSRLTDHQKLHVK